MSKTTKTNTAVVETNEATNPHQGVIDHVTKNKMSTSAIIRYVAASLKTDDDTFQSVNNKTYNFIKKHLPQVTTKSGGEIRYQHVRGVMSQILTGSKDQKDS